MAVPWDKKDYFFVQSDVSEKITSFGKAKKNNIALVSAVMRKQRVP